MTLAAPSARVWVALLGLAVISTALGYVIAAGLAAIDGRALIWLSALLALAGGLAVTDGRLLGARAHMPRP